MHTRILPNHSGRIFWRLLLFTLVGALIVGCSEGAVVPDPDSARYDLSTAVGAPIPVVLFEGRIVTDDGEFDLRLVVAQGYLVVNGDRYEQRLTLHQWVDGMPAPNFNWTDRGTVAPSGDMLLFESELIQNVAFFGLRGGNQIATAQDLLGITVGETGVVDLVFARS